MKKVYLNTLNADEIVKRLKSGEVVKIEGLNCFYNMVDCVVVRHNENNTLMFNCGINIDKNDDYYFEEEEPFKITETGFYKTRDERKAYVYCINNECVYPVKFVIENLAVSFEATQFGFLTDDGDECCSDLVSKLGE